MDKFEIIGITGEGTYGQVYKAKDKDTGKSFRSTCFAVLLPLKQYLFKQGFDLINAAAALSGYTVCSAVASPH